MGTPWAGPRRGPGPGGSIRPCTSYAEEGMALLHVNTTSGNKTDAEIIAHFHIPNFVNSLGEDDLLLGESELPIRLDSGCRSEQ